jgi:hypothetical protein
MSLFIHLDNRRELDFDVLSGEGLNESVNDQVLLTTKCRGRTTLWCFKNHILRIRD